MCHPFLYWVHRFFLVLSSQMPLVWFLCFFFFNDTATTEIYTLSLHDALPIWTVQLTDAAEQVPDRPLPPRTPRSEEHTSELQSRENLVCRLLLEKKKKTT